MKTLDNTLETGNRSRVRSLLAIVGVVTAIIGSLVFLHDVYGNARIAANVPNVMAASKVINGDLLLQATSTIWSIK
ncbi:hypothetical protein SAMN04488109_4982 [Chryseolinea serpens]|uniref:Uncharacterized protein n=1 Tax=Chryseolinea serpens TaxID=947013 RepID=A0A1M5VBS3_9BACT|nr:hypothetical protein [Chryseolinea serpens]SHH72598.1 hypothetical protein SAMN04488109_4982 [Chryseolinea serpens]